jgi:hypothetical protein
MEEFGTVECPLAAKRVSRRLRSNGGLDCIAWRCGCQMRLRICLATVAGDLRSALCGVGRLAHNWVAYNSGFWTLNTTRFSIPKIGNCGTGHARFALKNLRCARLARYKNGGFVGAVTASPGQNSVGLRGSRIVNACIDRHTRSRGQLLRNSLRVSGVRHGESLIGCRVPDAPDVSSPDISWTAGARCGVGAGITATHLNEPTRIMARCRPEQLE